MTAVTRLRTRRWLGLVGAAFLIVCVAAALGWRWSGGDRGALALWIEAAFTAVGFLAASTAAVFAAGAFGLERERDARLEQAQRRAQASLIAGWWETTNYWYDRITPLYDEGTRIRGIAGAQVRIRNASEVPVTNVTVRCWLKVHVVIDGEPTFSFQPLRDEAIEVLPPGTTMHVDVRAEPSVDLTNAIESLGDRRPSGSVAKGELPDFDISVELRFRDAAGVDWTRTPDGLLVDASP